MVDFTFPNGVVGDFVYDGHKLYDVKPELKGLPSARGGETLEVECLTMPGKGGLRLTGQLGDVMKEPAEAAFSYVRAHCADLGLADDF